MNIFATAYPNTENLVRFEIFWHFVLSIVPNFSTLSRLSHFVCTIERNSFFACVQRLANTDRSMTSNCTPRTSETNLFTTGDLSPHPFLKPTLPTHPSPVLLTLSSDGVTIFCIAWLQKTLSFKWNLFAVEKHKVLISVCFDYWLHDASVLNRIHSCSYISGELCPERSIRAELLKR